MPAKKYPRKQLFVDPKVQGALVLRAVMYWVVCLIAITLMLLCWRILTGPARMFYTHFADELTHRSTLALSAVSLSIAAFRSAAAELSSLATCITRMATCGSVEISSIRSATASTARSAALT